MQRFALSLQSKKNDELAMNWLLVQGDPATPSRISGRKWMDGSILALERETPLNRFVIIFPGLSFKAAEMCFCGSCL